MATRKAPKAPRRRSRFDGMSDAEIREAMTPLREGYARWKTDQRIDELVASAPALTAEQRARLAVLLGVSPDGQGE